MKKNQGLIPLFALLLTACQGMGVVSSGPNPFSITPSRPPLILTPTPVFILPTNSPSPLALPPTLTATSTLTGVPNITATDTPTATSTYIPTATFTATPGLIEILVLGCETGLDLMHGMGEVTNTFVVISNTSGQDQTNICATLSSADEGRVHPDKTACVPNLPNGYRVTLKLTIDTTFSAATIVEVAVTTDQGSNEASGALACNAIGSSKPNDDILGVIQPIQ